jgi:GNAT superfamily N-acetyltransferase
MYEFKNLTKEQIEDIEGRLEEYDSRFLPKPIDGYIQIGAFDKGKLIGGVNACMTSFRILYISTVFIDEDYRRKGVAKSLLEEVERQAKELGADLIRVDTFDWQGRDFYEAIGFEEVGRYEAEGFSEHFYLKRI